MPNQTLSPQKIFVVPGWILKAMLRNKLNTIDLMDYSKVREVLSLNDVAEWFYLNDRFEVDKCRLSNGFLDTHWHSFTPAQRAEVTNSVLPLSGSEEIANSAKTKLTANFPERKNTMSDGVYQFVVIDNILYIVLHEGFMTEIVKPEFKSEFVKKYLKECYAMASVSDVSRLAIFDLYVKQIAN